MDYADPNTGSEVPWARATPGLLRDIAKAPWKIVDVETTELNPASAPIEFSGKDLRRGVDPTPRLRVNSVLYPIPRTSRIEVVSFDYDKLSKSVRAEVSDASLRQNVIGHNAGFDVGWLRVLSSVLPYRVIDSMLVARALYPQQLLELAKLSQMEVSEQEEDVGELVISDIERERRIESNRQREQDLRKRQQARQAFEQERSGWSLADLCLTVFGRLVEKTLQGPRNWCEPFLTMANYTYATDDVRHVYDLMLHFFGIEPGEDIIAAYERLAVPGSTLKLFEPQVLDVVRMREKGMPWVKEEADKYVAGQRQVVREQAQLIVQIEPSLKSHLAVLENFDAGVTEDLRNALGQAFRNRGLVLETTEKTSLPKIGEKDLRKARAAQEKESKPLFEAWTKLCRAKKAGQMADDFSGFALRSSDGRIHSNIGHGPATGRLSSGEPNVQQAPRDQRFRDAVRAALGFKIVACDYSALDVRVAAALSIRAQRQIFEAYIGVREVRPDVLAMIKQVYDRKVSLEDAIRFEEKARTDFKAWKELKEEYEENGEQRQRYWQQWRELQRKELLTRFRRCLAYVKSRADKAGTAEWGSLRDAFSIEGMDIHTWTALSMQGEDPVVVFAGKSSVQIPEELKAHKKRLGPLRGTSGKIPNLALQYRMSSRGFQDYAASGFDVHWTIDEADEKRVKWLAAYVEVDLWHCWTELNEFCSIYVPDPDHGNQIRRKPVFASYTLADRLIYSIGVSSALAYEDQSTGADILGDVMAMLRGAHAEVFGCLVNQVHDEVVLEVPDERVEVYTKIVSDVMIQCADRYFAPYAVRAECSPAIGEVWIKD